MKRDYFSCRSSGKFPGGTEHLKKIVRFLRTAEIRVPFSFFKATFFLQGSGLLSRFSVNGFDLYTLKTQFRDEID